MRVPRKIKDKLAPICEATGLDAQEIWDRQSLATHLAASPERMKKFLDGLSGDKKAKLKYTWKFWARPAQILPTSAWFICLLLAGRGFGKSRTGAEFVIEQARSRPGSVGAIIGPTAGDVRSIMINGESGIIACAPPDFKPIYEPSKCLLTFPNLSKCLLYSADTPDRLRGPNLNYAWCDELASWRFPDASWDMLLFCTRSKRAKTGNPRILITTTPRPIELVKSLALDSQTPEKTGTIMIKGTTWDNYFNLAKDFFKRVVQKNKGALTRQEVFADILNDVEGALWTAMIVDGTRVHKAPPCTRIGIGIDPAEEAGKDNDETGIVAMGVDQKGHGYVFRDASMKAHPSVWARAAYDLYLELEADFIVVETQRGGKMVAQCIRSVIREGEPQPRIIEIKTGSTTKKTRADPIAGLYCEGKIHHVGVLPILEDQMYTYVPGVSKKSPDRLDAMVWIASLLFKATLEKKEVPSVGYKEKPRGW